MSKKFNPDEYLNELESLTPSKKDIQDISVFDPNEYLSGFDKEKQIAEPEKMSALAALGQGIGQGASLGFSDELAGFVGATLDPVVRSFFAPKEEDVLSQLSPEARARVEKFGIDATPAEETPMSREELLEFYTQTARDSLSKARKDQPLAAFGGEILGGVAIPGGVAARGAGLAAKIGTGVKTGAALGAVTGFGSSEGGFDERVEGAKTGALAGAALGAAPSVLPVLGKGAVGAAKGLGGALGEGLEFLGGPMGKGFRQAFKKPILGDSARDALQEQAARTGQELGEDAQQTLIDLAKRSGKSLDEAGEAGARVDLTEEIDTLSQQLDEFKPLGKAQSSDKSKLESILEDYSNLFGSKADIKPAEAQDVKQAFSELSKFGDESLKTSKGKGIVNSLVKSMRDKVKESAKETDFEDVNKQIGSLKAGLESLGINPKNLDDNKTMNKFVQMIKGEIGDTESSGRVRVMTQDFLNSLEKADPVLAKKYSEKLVEAADDAEVIRALNRPVGISPILLARAAGTRGSIYAGTAARGISNLAKDLVDKSPEELQRLIPVISERAKALGKTGSTAATSLQNTLARASQADDSTRKALLFAATQNPAFRDLMRDDKEE